MFSNDLFVMHFGRFALCCTAEFAFFKKTVSMYSELIRKCLPSAVALNYLLVYDSVYHYQSIFSSSTKKFKYDLVLSKRQCSKNSEMRIVHVMGNCWSAQ